MKKTGLKICSVIARLSRSTAFVSAGLASSWGWYQPKVPKRISK